MVCAGLLKRHTEYGRGIDASSPCAVMFWSVLSSMSPEEQALFLRFTYARTRLPTTDAGFTRKFKLQRTGARPGCDIDRMLPIAHTCVFQLNIPEYSSADVMRRQLLLACSLCVGYDLDDAGHPSSVPFDEDGEPDE